MRRFDAEYLRTTRRGMWADSREALAPLVLADCERVLEVGCGTGALTAVLAEETPGTVVGCDVDRRLLEHARSLAPVVAGDATSLPFADDAADCVVCQALLINLPDPAAALAEFARASRDRVAAIEPDNGAVTVDSTVDAEPALEARARDAYLEGVGTDVELGAVAEPFERAGLEDVTVRRYDHTRTVAPPYDEHALRDARRKASGEGLADDRATMLAGGLSLEEFDDLRAAWRAMGRSVVAAMQREEYRRTETVPFYVTVGHL